MTPILLMLWAVLAVILTQAGFPREQIRMATEAALIPVWFLAVYLLASRRSLADYLEG